MVKQYIVHEYGEAKAQGRTVIVEANSSEEAIKKSPFQEWGCTTQEISSEGFCYNCQESDGNILCDKEYCGCPCHKQNGGRNSSQA